MRTLGLGDFFGFKQCFYIQYFDEWLAECQEGHLVCKHSLVIIPKGYISGDKYFWKRRLHKQKPSVCVSYKKTM